MSRYVFLFSLDSGFSIHGEVYVLLSLDKDYSIHVKIYISVFSG